MKKYLMAAFALLSMSILVIGSTAEALTDSSINDTHGVTGGIYTSINGRYIAFLSSDSSLVSGDVNNRKDAFLHDTITGSTSLLSVSTTGTQGNDNTNQVSLSGNGRYALLSSYASNLASGGSSVSPNVYLRDIKLGTTVLVSNNATATAISEDGRFVYYVAGSDHSLQMKDITTNTTTRIDVDSGGAGSKGVGNNEISASCDGRFVVFESTASDLVSGDTNGKEDVFLTDTLLGHVIKDLTINGDGASYVPYISCDGNYIYYSSDATNLVASDTNSATDIFQYDVANDTTRLVTLDSSGNQYGTTSSLSGGVSRTWGGNIASMDGRYVVFSVDKVTSIPGSGQVATGSQVFLRDTIANTTTALSPSGSSNFGDWPVMTYDGRTVYYGYGTLVNSRNVHSITNYL